MTSPESPAPDDSPGFGAIEDLDPEPAGRTERGRRWELAVGLVLVLGLVALGLGQWGQQQTKLAAYQAGQRAAAAHDWDAARAAFAAAAGYADSASRRDEAARLAIERDQQYDRITGAIEEGAWPWALQAVQRLEAIAPNYRDSAQLAQRVRQAVFTEALGGTVVLRPAANPPGLYTYGRGGWQWLQGSDVQSRALAFCPDGNVLLDTPAGPARRRAGSTAPAVRQLVLDTPADGHTLRVLSLDPDRLNQFLCTESGVWGSVAYFDTGRAGSLVGGLLAPPATLTYQPWDGSAAITPVFPDAGAAVVNIAPDGRHLLVAEIAGLGQALVRTRLYLADPQGSQFRLLDDRDGTLISTEFSPDGRYLLLVVYRLLNDLEAAKSVLLIDLTAPSATRALTEASITLGTSYELLDPAGAFLRAGPRTGQIVVSDWIDGQPVLRLLDPAHPEHILAEVPMDNIPAQLHFARDDPSGVTLLGWQSTAAAADGASNTLAVLDAQGRATLVYPLADAVADLDGAWVRQDRLVYLARVFTVQTQQAAYAVRSRPLAAPTAGPGAATELFRVPIPWPPPSLAWERTPPWRIGANFLAYVTPTGELHARTYDGALDLLLDKGIGTLYSEP